MNISDRGGVIDDAFELARGVCKVILIILFYNSIGFYNTIVKYGLSRLQIEKHTSVWVSWLSGTVTYDN